MTTFFVSEVSSNHHQDRDRCFDFIKKSASIGCDAVKFQLFKVEQLFAPEILAKSEEHRRRKAWELPLDFLPELKSCCQEANIQFSCTPFYLKAVEELFPYVDFYKIASYELLWNDLLTEVAKTGKPVVVSTGMATLEEVKTSVGILHQAGCEDLTLLHCVSGYPTPVLEANLKAIATLKTNFNCKVGWSDHTVNPAVIYRAVHKWEAEMIEFHLDLEGKGDEFKTGHCWLPSQIKSVIDNIKLGMIADGTGEKKPTLSEMSDRPWRADKSDGLRPLLSTRQEWKV